jgi:hypothetical protein
MKKKEGVDQIIETKWRRLSTYLFFCLSTVCIAEEISMLMEFGLSHGL